MATKPDDATVSHHDLEGSSSRTQQAYDVQLAELTEQQEREMPFRKVISESWPTILICLASSSCIILEGYCLAMLTLLFTFPKFKTTYGETTRTASGEAEWEVAYRWQVLLPLAGQIGACLGNLVAGKLIRFVGYKKGAILGLVALLFLNAITFFAPSTEILFVGWLLQGIPWGVFQVSCPGWASDVAPLQLRPITTTWINVCWVLGQLLASIVGEVFSRATSSWAYRGPFLIQWVFVAILTVVLCFTAESPYWYLRKQRHEEAARSVYRLLSKTSSITVDAKLALMKHTIAQEDSQKLSEESVAGWKKQLDIFRGTDRQRTEVSCMTWIIQAVCGSALVPWAPYALHQAGLAQDIITKLNIGIQVIAVVGTLGAWALMRRAGRRHIVVRGLLGMGLVMTVMGGLGFIPHGSGWIMFGVLLAFTLLYDLTIGPITYTIVAELPSVRLKPATLALARALYTLAGMANHCIIPMMLRRDKWNLGAKTGLIFGGICLVSAIYSSFRLPETKDLHPRQIDLLFNPSIDQENQGGAAK